MFLPDSFFDEILKRYNVRPTAEILSKWSILSAVLVSVSLAILKTFAWIATNSITIQASLLDSAMDAFSSLCGFIAIRYSFKEEDEEHGFGHGKIEGVVSLAQVVFMSIACWSLLNDAIESFDKTANQIESPVIGMSVMVVSTILVYILVSFQMYSAHKTQSTIVTSDSLHYSADLFMNLGVMLSFVLSNFIPYLDAIAGIAVCAYVFIGMIRVFNASMKDLMDAELPKEDKVRIVEALRLDREVLQIVHMKTRRSGTKKIVHIDVKISCNYSFVEAYAISKRIEKSIADLFLHSEVIVAVIPSDE